MKTTIQEFAEKHGLKLSISVRCYGFIKVYAARLKNIRIYPSKINRAAYNNDFEKGDTPEEALKNLTEFLSKKYITINKGKSLYVPEFESFVRVPGDAFDKIIKLKE